MLKVLVRRLLSAIPLLLLLSLFVFVLLDLMEGDAARAAAGEDATPEDVEAARERLGLNQPLLVRYVVWLVNAVQGDLGESLLSSQSVSSLIAERVPVTLSLAVVTLVIAVAVGIPLGVAAAMRANRLLDRVVTALASLTMAMPPFVIGLVLVLVFAVNSSLFPATGYSSIGEDGVGGWLQHLVLPALALAAISAAEFARQTRAALVDTLGQDFMRTVRAKGLRSRMIIGKHGMKNAGIPIVTVFGLQAGRILAGAVTVEFVFALPGFGSLAVTAVNQRDIPVILGIVMVSAVTVLVINLIVDVSYGYFNPRLRS
ncbi:ABC transporter permease [Pseudonocardia kunmingensis]|uniref:Peptide/nickel transport system permease protein n=1 Tax=Pseudonocardia kunmingensis TaxID=630975 RepID=A0A543DPU9_9PSEU|nr:ABC transporter permease [Pseudonocardia kunmingensis]TQM11335.1 peptide/nickel transport system permease protein [Pseudonocardia kunmingensis]